jgi:magnesium-protoporphyrin O-methyltransferase
MPCCCQSQVCGTGRFFSRFARRYRKRYLKKGLEDTQRQLVKGVTQAGVIGATLLEIGCGVGFLHQTLLKSGAASALGIDLSERLLAEAALLAREQGLAEHVHYRQGDFVELAGEVAPADITLLDKVVCCYPDAAALVNASLAKTRRVYALTYPRDRLITRLGVRLMACLFWLVRSPVRNYVHDPVQIETWVRAAGFRKAYQNQTLLWLTQVYVRE